MTTVTFYIPDAEVGSISQMIEKRGGKVFVKIKEKLTNAEQTSLNKALDEAQKIQTGELTALDFDDLGDDEAIDWEDAKSHLKSIGKL